MSPFAGTEIDEEAVVEAPSSVATSNDADDAAPRKRKKSSLHTMFFLVAACVATVLTYKTMLDGLSVARGRPSSRGGRLASLSADELELHAVWLANDFRESWTFEEPVAGEVDRRRRLELDASMTEVIKTAWPACVNRKMTGIQCKKFITKELLTLFTGPDRVVQKDNVADRGTEVIAGRRSGITLTITTETYESSAAMDLKDATLEEGQKAGSN